MIRYNAENCWSWLKRLPYSAPWFHYVAVWPDSPASATYYLAVGADKYHMGIP